MTHPSPAAGPASVPYGSPSGPVGPPYQGPVPPGPHYGPNPQDGSFLPGGPYPSGQQPPNVSFAAPGDGASGAQSWPVPPGTGPSAAVGNGVVTLLRVLAVPATALGLSIPFDSSCLWATSTAWAVFAMLAALVQAAPLLAGSLGWTVERGWSVGAVGAGCLLLFWVLVALPSVGSNTGFTLTVAAATAAAGCVFGPGRRF